LNVVEKDSQGKYTNWDLVPAKYMELSSDYTETVSFTGKCGITYRVDATVGDSQANHVHYIYPDAIKHSYSFTETPATCGTTGSRTGVCQYCGATHTDTIQPTGEHNYAWVTVTAPTYSTEGLRHHKCTVCGNIDATEPIEKLGNTFVDVAAGAYYYTPVLWAYYHNPQVTGGNTATTFNPNGYCTRAQIVTFLWRANGCPEPSSTVCKFTDVPYGSYYYKAVLWAVEKGITGGYNETTFGSNDYVTRAQAVTFLWRSAGCPAPASLNNSFTDVPTGSYYYYAVRWANEKNITGGYDAYTFGSTNSCTRANIVTFLYRSMN